MFSCLDVELLQQRPQGLGTSPSVGFVITSVDGRCDQLGVGGAHGSKTKIGRMHNDN
jgi:hypothetical protein